MTKTVAEKPSKKSQETSFASETYKSSSKTPPSSSSKQSAAYDPYGRREESTRGGVESSDGQSKSGFKSPGSSSAAAAVSKSSSTTSPPTTSSAAATYQTEGAKLAEAQRAALEAAMQQQSHKDMLGAYRPSPVFPSLSGLSGLSPYHHPGLAGLDAATAAALGAFRHPAYSAAAHLGYPPVSLGLSLASYQQALSAASYGRLATGKPTGDSVCRDPYCTGCPSAMAAASQAAVTSSSTSPITTSSSCPAGCTQCDHIIRTTAGMNSNSSSLAVMSSAQSSSLSTVSSTPSTIVTSTAQSPDSVASRPYVCNWIAADHYCGKRFTSSEELLQHLRTHTSLSVPSAAPSSAEQNLSSPSYSPLLNPSLHPHSHLLAASSALHRTYPTPPLSPLSMARYHPYSKPPTSASPHLSAAAAIPPPPPNPLLSLHHPYAGLGAYYSTHPYSLYSQRMLAGAGVLP